MSEITKEYEDEFYLFTETKKAREYCFGNYNNATRDEHVGYFCYVEGRTKSQSEIEQLKQQLQVAVEALNDIGFNYNDFSLPMIARQALIKLEQIKTIGE